jgi:8-oxo-dGTP diphosphatase
LNTTDLADLTVSEVAVDLCKLIHKASDLDPYADITYSANPSLTSITVIVTSNITAKSRKFEVAIRDAKKKGDVTDAHLVADLVLFAHRFGKPHVLLVKRRWKPFADDWALPGGYLRDGEDFEAAARREGVEETGIRAPQVLTEVGTFGKPDRDPRNRVVTIAFTATLDEMPTPVAKDDATDARWWPVTDLPKLAFDHDDIVRAALGKS